MHLVSCLTPNYRLKALQYLQSVSLVKSVPVSIVLVGWDRSWNGRSQTLDYEHEWFLKRDLPHVHFPHLPLPAAHSHLMIQWGCWLDCLPEIEDHEVVLLTDMDIRIQRDFGPEEIEWFDSLGENELTAGWNCGTGDTLAQEGVRIALSDQWKGEWEEIPCLNCGVIAARVSTWKRLRENYESDCFEFYSHCAHRSRCQFHMNHCFNRLGLDLVELPTRFHLHGHFLNKEGVPVCDPQAKKENGIWYSQGVPVVLAHKL